MPNEF